MSHRLRTGDCFEISYKGKFVIWEKITNITVFVMTRLYYSILSENEKANVQKTVLSVTSVCTSNSPSITKQYFYNFIKI